MIKTCLGRTFSGNGCDFISKDIFQLIAGNERASFLTNEEGRNFRSSPWGAIIIEARFFFFLLYTWGENTGGLTYLIGHVQTTLLGQENRRKPWERQHVDLTKHTLAPNKNTGMGAGGTHPAGYQDSAHCCHVEHYKSSTTCLPYTSFSFLPLILNQSYFNCKQRKKKKRIKSSAAKMLRFVAFVGII